MRFVLFVLAFFAFVSGMASSALNFGGAIVSGISMVSAAILFSAAAIVDAIVVFEKRVGRRIDGISGDSTKILYHLQKSTELLDPDGSKAKAIEAEATKEEFRAMQDEARRKKAIEDDKKAREEEAKAKDLSKAVVDAECPNCHKKIRIADLRPGVRHTCPACQVAFKT